MSLPGKVCIKAGDLGLLIDESGFVRVVDVSLIFFALWCLQTIKDGRVSRWALSVSSGGQSAFITLAIFIV